MKYVADAIKSLFVSGLIFIFGCGGGTDIGNPDIRGAVCYSNGKRVSGAMVVRGSNGWQLEDAVINYTEKLGNIDVTISSKGFDTTFCDPNGEFTFSSVIPGEYVLLASGNAFLGIQSINHSYHEESYAEICVMEPVELSIVPYYEIADSSVKFSAVRVSGTPVYARADSLGTIKLNTAPSGELELILYRENGDVERYSGLETDPGCSTILKVDPLRSKSYWTPMISSGTRDPLGRPYIIWSSPLEGDNTINTEQAKSLEYDLEIQFSHPMDTRNTTTAVSVYSPDNCEIDSIWWQGADIMRLSFNKLDNLSELSGDFLYDYDVEYSIIIDTNAQSALGVRFAYPDTLSFILHSK
ncbi:MAG: hypothetical protein Q4F84_07530 [Fibrobacter sp.]|nr:hypothetical protein [Fibrobacter sp.]